MNEMAVVLGTLLPRYELELADDRELRMVRRNLVMAPEEGVPMRLVGRLARTSNDRLPLPGDAPLSPPSRAG